MLTKERIGMLVIAFVAVVVVEGAKYMVGSTILGAGVVPSEVSAHKFVLLNDAGKTRAVMDVMSGEVAQLRLMDNGGTVRVGLGVASEGVPGLGIYDKNGKVQLEISYGANTRRLRMFNEDGTVRLALGGYAEWGGWYPNSRWFG